MPPVVSIITPAFNSAKLIGETIRSVLDQTFRDWEMLIVVDLGTTDNTVEIVKSFIARDARIKLIEIKNGRGISLSRNAALAEAVGKFVTFLDSDDLWLPAKLEVQVKKMLSDDLVFSCGGYRRINFDKSITGKYVSPPPRQTYHDLLCNNLIACPTVMFDQTKTGKLKMEEHAHEDYLLWLKISKMGFECIGIDQDFARYRIVPNSRSMQVGRASSRWRVYRNYEGLSPYFSTYYFIRYAVTAILKRLRF